MTNFSDLVRNSVTTVCWPCCYHTGHWSALAECQLCHWIQASCRYCEHPCRKTHRKSHVQKSWSLVDKSLLTLVSTVAVVVVGGFARLPRPPAALESSSKAAPDQRELGAHLSVHAASSFLFRQLKYFHICVTSISMRVLQVFPLGVFNVFPSIPNFSWKQRRTQRELGAHLSVHDMRRRASF